MDIYTAQELAYKNGKQADSPEVYKSLKTKDESRQSVVDQAYIRGYEAALANNKSVEETVLSVITRIIKDDSNYINTDFGSETNALYIDGSTHYFSADEKAIVKQWIQQYLPKQED